MNYKKTAGSAFAIIIGLLFAVFWKGDVNLAKRFGNKANQERTHSPDSTKNAQRKEKKFHAKKTKRSHAKRTLKPVIVIGPHGRDEDIAPTLDRIKRGEKFPHRNDGTRFGNREKRLPLKARNYYLEYVHPTKGRRGPGGQRVILGNEKEIFYTPDHYKTFQRVNNAY